LSTQIITKTKVPIDVIEPSELVVQFDPDTPEGSEVRVEVFADRGLIRPAFISVTTDYEVEAEVRALLDSEALLLSVDPNSYVEADVEHVFGEVLVKKLILVARTFFPTTAARVVTLKYSGAIYEFR
jgi:hypothetical protein